jgi:hypothetical protein
MGQRLISATLIMNQLGVGWGGGVDCGKHYLQELKNDIQKQLAHTSSRSLCITH